MKEDVRLAISKALNQTNLEISEDMELRQIQGWDSLKYVNLIIELEKKFMVKVPLGSLAKMTTIAAIAETINDLKENAIQ